MGINYVVTTHKIIELRSQSNKLEKISYLRYYEAKKFNVFCLNQGLN